MKNLKKTAFKVMSTAALLTTAVAPVLAAPASSFAAGAGSVSAYTVPTIANQSGAVDLGTVLMTIPSGALTGSNDTVTLSLPHGFTFGTVDPSVEKTVANSTYNVSVYQTQGSQTVFGNATVSAVSNNQIKIQLNTVGGSFTGATDDVKLAVALHNITVNGPTNGPVNVTLDAPSASAFPTGSVTVANVQTNGIVDLAATDTTSGSNAFTFNLNLKEEIAGSLRTQNAIKLKLPSGYQWTTGAGSLPNGSSSLYGAAVSGFNITGSGDTIYINAATPTSTATSLKIPLAFQVSDDTQVKAGPVNVYVSGTSTTNVSSLQVGNYGDYSASVTAASTPDVLAGQSQQTIGDITIKESVPGTFVSGRTVELTLPDSARWEDVFEGIANNKGVLPSVAPTPNVNITTTNGLQATASFTGTDDRTLKLTFSGQGSINSTDPGEIDLKNVQIATSARAKGDINLTVGGTSGVTGTVKVAAGKATGTIAVSKVASLVPGKAGQPIGDVTITETKAGAFNKDSVAGASNSSLIKVSLDAVGAQWDAAPTVTVTSGDAKVTNVYTSGPDLYMTLDSASGAAPATFTLTGGTVKTDNTLPTGQFNIKLKGTAVDYAANVVSAWSNDTTTMSAAPVANVTQGLFGSTGNHVVFTIGKSNYSLNGTDTTLDAPAFIDANGRTQLPVRALSEALGATVGWDQDSQTVSVLKDGKAIAITVGAAKMNVGGVPVALDSAAVNKDGRVFLPFRAIAEALGATVAWDATAQTVTLN